MTKMIIDNGMMTIGNLLDRMEKMQAYIDQLQEELEITKVKSRAQISELQKKNDEYKRAILQMRDFSRAEETGNSAEKRDPENMAGHELLGSHGKILVIGGQELGDVCVTYNKNTWLVDLARL